ncbi:spore maturation protein [Paenibacillus darwinianus]|uniref:Spore maturation protein n=2 Tax=Paenibacillus darwinianus TaxID=1380763 RepID=A0A9W5S177_9BACL|nr:spore maturation protein [Paenibacillus darwinianus]EXX89591.1 spore maturation protein [Paenibacillus darwinianus]EXX89807.1 spore maturation protein [Paenibacillus darwinianus]
MSMVGRGRESGLRDGFARGWRDGVCRAISESALPNGIRKRNLRVLFVPQGFEAIDDGVADGLEQNVSELYTASPERMYEQAALVRPDLVLVMNGLHVFPADHPDRLDAVRALGIRTAVWFADDPYMTEETVKLAPRYDTVVTHELSTAGLYRQIGCGDVHYMPLAADAGRFKPMPIGPEYRSDVCFIGQAFRNRAALFDAAAPGLKGLNVRIFGGLWDRLRTYRRLKPSIRLGWLPVDESVRYYNGAKIVINVHRTAEAGSDNRNALRLPGRSINPRTFEIAACGAFQLTDRREDLERYYRPGIELETFESPAELVTKIRHYLEHEEERGRIAARGLARTLREHLYPARVNRLLSELGYDNEQERSGKE